MSLQLFDSLPAHIEAALRDSIEEFGVLVPVFVTQDGEVIDGHHRSRIANDLGVDFETVVIEVDDEDHALRVAHTLNADRRQLAPSDRLKAAARLRERGHSYRAIGEALGTSHEQARRDVQSTVTDVTVEPERVVGIDGKSRPAKVTERRTESTTVEAPRVASEPQSEAAEDAPPVDLASLPGAEDRAYVRSYLAARGRALDAMRFDADRLRDLLTPEQIEGADHIATAWAEHADAIAPSGALRAIEGGRK